MDSVLFVSHCLPGSRLFGSDTRMVRVLAWFRERGIRVHFVHLTRSLIGSLTSEKPAGCASFHEIHIAGCQPLGNDPLAWKRMTRSRSLFFQRYWSERLRPQESIQARIAALLNQTHSNLLWIGHSILAPAAPEASQTPGVLRIIDTIDILHLRDETLRAAGLPPEQGLSRDDERRHLSPFDVVVAIQNQERDELRSMLPDKTVITIGHATELVPQPCYTGDLCFVGSKYFVNEANLQKFLEHAWPTIRQQCPGTRLQIAGGVGKCEAVVKAARLDARIIVRGIVPQVADIYSGPAVVVCPSWIGSGLKIKVVEALAHGKAVVASPIAAQGLEDGIDSAFLLAREPADFISPVVQLLQNAPIRQQCELAAASYARQHFHSQQVWGEMDQVLANWRAQSAPAKAA